MGSTERAEEISFLEEKGKGEKKKSWTRSKDKQAAHSEGAEQNTPRCIFFFFFFFNSLEGVGDGKEEPRWQQEGSPGARSCAGRGGAAGRAEHTPH